MSIKLKVVVAVLSSLALSALANAWLSERFLENDVQALANQAGRAAAEAYAGMERGAVDKLGAALEALAAHPALAQAYARRDRDALLRVAAPIFDRLRDGHGVTHWYFHDPEPRRTCFLRVHAPHLHGDVVNRPALSQAIARKAPASGKELGKTAFALRVVRPWYRDGSLLGYLELGQEIDQFLQHMKLQSGDEFGLMVLKRFLDRREWAVTRGAARDTWDDLPEVVVVDSTVGDGSLLDLAGGEVPQSRRVLDAARRGERFWARAVVPVTDAGGATVGALLVLHDITAPRRSTEDHARFTLAVVLAVALGVSILLVLLLERLVFGRLDAMIGRLEDLSARLAGGDYQVGRDLPPPRDDEIGRFEAFLGRFLGVVAEALQDLQRRDGGNRQP